MLEKVRDAIFTFKEGRRRSGDGIETQIYDWIKLLFRIQLPAYHGGELIGKDCVNMMADAHDMFTHFSGILKTNKKEDCPYTNEMIDKMCANFARLSVLWDAAFSLASKINPTPDELRNYK